MHLSFVLYFCSQIVDGLRSPSAVAVDAITTGLQVRNHLDVRTTSRCVIDLFTDTAAILNLLVSLWRTHGRWGIQVDNLVNLGKEKTETVQNNQILICE